MATTLRDEFAIQLAAALGRSGRPAAEVAARAYAIADAMLRERSRFEPALDEDDAEDPRLEAPPHDPSWEVEPRWSLAERARHDERAAELGRLPGPGLAGRKPGEVDPARRVS